MSKASDEAESDLSEASSDIQQDESMEREISDFGKQARDLHKKYHRRRNNEASGVEKVMKDLGTAERDASDEEIRAVSEELGTLEDREVHDVAKFGNELEKEEEIEDEIQGMILNIDEAENDIGEALSDIGTDLGRAEEIIQKDPSEIGKSAVQQFGRDVEDLENAAKIEDEAENEIENIIQDLATLENEDNQLERFEKNLQSQLRKEDGVIEELGEDAEKMGDQKLLKKARQEHMELGKLKKKLSKDERITKEAEERLGKEIEEIQDELMKVENVEEVFQDREEQLEQLAEEARQKESQTDPETRKALERMAQMAGEGASSLGDALKQDSSKLRKEEKQVSKLEKRLGKLSASGGSSRIKQIFIAAAVIIGGLLMLTVI